MISGEFIVTDAKDQTELILPNQFTTLGLQQVLASAFWATPALWLMGMCQHNPGDNLALTSIGEPTLGVNGYARQDIRLDKTHWPIMGNVNGESYMESLAVVFPASAAWDKQVNRLFITDGTYVIAVSSAFPAGLLTISAPSTQKYRLYFR